MKKRLNTEGLINELKGSSAFFPDYKRPAVSDATDEGTSIPASANQSVNQSSPHTESAEATTTPRHHDTTVSRHHDTTTPLMISDIYEVVRKAVKQIGKEAATHRFTTDEKARLSEIEYTYSRQGIKTSENEITRIAINYLVEDYHQYGEESILAKCLNRLNS